MAHRASRLSAGALSALSLAALLPLAGCEDNAFQGSVLAISVAWPFKDPVTPTQPLELKATEHLEMWARLGTGQIVRLNADVTQKQLDTGSAQKFTGFTMTRAINPDDPCLIRGLDVDDRYCAEEFVQPDGYPANSHICGAHMFGRTAQLRTPSVPSADTSVTDPSVLLAQQALVEHGRQVTDTQTPFNAVVGTPTGKAPAPLFAMVQYNPDLDPTPTKRDPRTTGQLKKIDTTTAETEMDASFRLLLCRQYRDGKSDGTQQAHPFFYVGNPRQYTKPLAGVLFGFFSFATSATNPDNTPSGLPTQNFGGITFSVPIALGDIQQLLITRETTQSPTVPNTMDVLYTGIPLPEGSGGRGVIRMALFANPAQSLPPPPAFNAMAPVGTAAILTNLTERLD